MPTRTKLTKNLLSRAEALALVPDYVAFIEGEHNWELFNKIYVPFQNLRVRQPAVTYIDGQYVRVKVSSINHNTYQAVDGPVVRVSNGEFSWRVDGDRYAMPITTEEPCSTSKASSRTG